MATRDDEIRSLYREALLLARRRGFALNRAAVEQLYLVYAEALVGIAEETDEGTLDAARAEAMQRQIEATLQALQREIATLTGRGVAGTAREVADLHRLVNRELVRRHAPALAATVGARFDTVPIRAVQAMVARGPTAGTFQTLIRRSIQAIGPEVDTFLGAAVTRGVSAGRAAKDLARLMARGDPALLRLLDRTNVTLGDLHRGAGAIDYAAYGLDEADTKALRSVLYDARRIVVTNVNDAYREADRLSMMESPVVKGAKWSLSTSHPHPDGCDLLAETDAYGMGRGVYPPPRLPLAPHPFCQCSASGVVIREPSEWSRPKDPPPPLAIDPDDPRHTAKHAERWTEAERTRNQSTLAAILRATSATRTEAAA